MNVLVTGGAGFLGSHVVDALVERGHHVTIFDLVKSKWAPASIRSIVGDLRDASAVEEAVRGHEAVYHLGGFADLNAGKTQPLLTAQANVLGTLHVLEAMRAHGVRRLMFASTAYVYSREGGFYRCSKQACENYIEEYGRRFAIEATVIRYGSLYGTRADASNGVYRLLRAAIQEGRVLYSGAPDDLREYIHVEDAATLSVDVLEQAYVGQALLLTGPTSTRASDLFLMFQEILGQTVSVEYRNDAAGHYAVTPYAYTPRPGKKLIATQYVDMGQGLLRLIEEIHHGNQQD